MLVYVVIMVHGVMHEDSGHMHNLKKQKQKNIHFETVKRKLIILHLGDWGNACNTHVNICALI